MDNQRKNRILAGSIIFILLSVLLSGIYVVYKKIVIKESNDKVKYNKNADKYIGTLEYNYDDNGIPGSSYYINLSYGSKKLYVKEINFCSAVNCKSITTEKTILLTNEEIKKIWDITHKDNYNKNYLSGALSSLLLDEAVMDKKTDHEDYWKELYADYDLNGNGIITYREFGNYYLNVIISEEKE